MDPLAVATQSDYSDLAEQFNELCKEHDLTYSYSDDYRNYVRGRHHHEKIMELSKLLPHNLAVEIWNKNVREKLNPEYVEDYLWI